MIEEQQDNYGKKGNLEKTQFYHNVNDGIIIAYTWVRWTIH